MWKREDSFIVVCTRVQQNGHWGRQIDVAPTTPTPRLGRAVDNPRCLLRHKGESRVAPAKKRAGNGEGRTEEQGFICAPCCVAIVKGVCWWWWW